MQEMISIVGPCGVRTDEPMDVHTTFHIGGRADYFVMPSSVDELRELLKFLKANKVYYYIIGNGSNLLVSDAGFRGVIIQLADAFDGVAVIDDTTVEVMSGMLLSRLGRRLADRGLSGFEFATGIPGTVGGAVRMNAGAYGGEMKDIVLSAKVLDERGNLIQADREQLEFGYRTSSIVRNNYIVVSVTMRFTKGEPGRIKQRLTELAEKRRAKQPLEFPSAGSTFKRPDGHFAAKLIEDAGLKGLRSGGAMVSEKHSGFVVNTGGATAADVCALTDRIRDEVFEKFGVKLELEIVKLGFE